MTALDLLPLSLGELLDRTFFLYRRHFFLFTGIAAIPFSLFFVINLSVTLLSSFHLGAPSPTVSRPFPSVGVGAALTGGVVVVLVVVVAGVIAYLFSVGATVFAVSEIYTGHRTSIHESLRRVRGHAGTIFGVLVLTGLIMLGGLVLFVLPGAVFGSVMMAVGLVSFVIVAFYVGCRICVAVAAALLENIGPADGIRRSFDLTKDFAGRAFMIYLLYFAMAWGVIAVFQFPFVALIAIYAKQPHLLTVFNIFSQVGNFLANVLITPVSTISFAVFYYDLRVRKEGFDLQMMMQAIGGAPLPPPPISGGVPSMFGRDAS